MHRFRKKSETKRIQGLPSLHDHSSEDQESIPELPPASDFRTSLILPDLSRRFTLLRSSSGDPVTLEDLRSRFAEQRARGAENQISEEEEDMILETLGRIRSRNTAERSEESIEGVDQSSSTERQSVMSTGTASSSLSPSVTSSPGGRSTKRYSNNLFGSGRFRDYTYMRSVASTQSRNGSSRALSITPTESSLSMRGNTSSTAESLRPVTPDGSMLSSSVQSSPNEKTSVRSAPFVPPIPYGEPSLSAAEYRLSKTLGPSVLKRASLALEEAIKEIEEEAEDEIVMPRTAPVPRTSLDQPWQSSELKDSDPPHSSGLVEPIMAISSDKQLPTELDERRASPIPSRILPGYIPGMPRPMTPRDFDLVDRSHSTTPRATSPVLSSLVESSASAVPLSLTSGLFRRESSSSNTRQSPRPLSPNSSPMFLQRSTNGRFTPDDSQRSGDSFTEFDNPFNSSILTRRRPASPLSAPVYQPMAVSSRPSTPSNVVWTTSPNSNVSAQKPSGHHRNGSWVSDADMGSSTDTHASKNGSRSLRSPALPDSPLFDHGHSAINSFSPTSSPPDGANVIANRPSSNTSGIDLGSPVLSASRAQRSPTPTQLPPRSPISPTFPNYEASSRNGSRRSSKQNPPSSPFSTGPFPPFVFSPIANSSRSSLESAGSSYHSWDGEVKDRSAALFNDVDPQQSAWHELSGSDKSSSATPGSSPDEVWDAEDIIARYAGLKKTDFLAIQEKLVGVAIAKSSAPETRDRTNSLRRRRPSTSQSNYSVNGRENRMASPPPQTQPPASPMTSTPTPDQYSKASALLNSVVDSIQSPRDPPAPLKITDVNGSAFPSDRDISPTTRRNRDLAQVLFGLPDDDVPKEQHKPDIATPSTQPSISHSHQSPESTPVNSVLHDPNHSPPLKEPNHPANSIASPYQLRNPSTPRIPHTPQEEADLAREVQQKTDAAMLALKKRPSNSNIGDGTHHTGTISRKRISPHQISTPKLVSASTSVDTIPLRSLGAGLNPAPSKLGSRFKKLRGTLRAKHPMPTGEEVSPYPLDLRTPPASQTAHYDPSKLHVPGPGGASATETGRFKVPIPSPPASAGPGLKGFMARLRGKQRMPETVPETGSSQLSRPPATVTTSQPQHQHPNPNSSDSALSPMPPRQPSQPSHVPHLSSDSNESSALKQLFDAASNLGLDQSALNDLLARTPSTSSRSTDWTMMTRNNSVSMGTRLGTHEESPAENPRMTATPPDQRSADGLRTPVSEPIHARSSMDNASTREESVSRRPTVRKQPDNTRRPRDGQNDAAKAVVRRTIIFPSEGKGSAIDLNALMRKNSSHRRRASAASISSRSVHDRAPTPPPPRSPTTKRFSNDGFPPVPHLPLSLASQADNLLNLPMAPAGGPIEKSSSTYDSLYEMYAGESKGSGSMSNDHRGPGLMQPPQGDFTANPESGPALEVIELANGETIWSIVNGLRDDDDESVYQSRTSFASEYSNENAQGLQIFVKEHGRSGSKGSSSSYLSSRKKHLQGKSRPETKVFYSSSAQIGRLIENLSQGMDSGSFNFLPTPHVPGHSASSSLSTNDMHWTVEERLEHMLGSMATPQSA